MSNFLSKLYRQKLTILTDLYQLTMAYGYWKNGMYDQEAVFHLFFRKHPFKGNYTIAAGLESVIHFLNDFKFSVDDIQYLGSLKGADGKALFDEGFLNYLQRLEFTCDVDAIPEGTAVFPHQPLLRIKGPLLQAQLIETTLLTLINFPTLIATKAARICQAAQGDTVLEFGLRRAQGIDGGLTASRSAYIGGCHATSNVLAGKLFGIPVKGTHAHSWVMSVEDEPQAFASYADAMPNNCVFLVDTYDTIQGVKYAIEAGHELREKGHEMLGIRLDSGDLADLSIKARKLLDEAGFPKTQIVASDSLNEVKIKALKEKGAKIDVWGVGTQLATAYDQPALGGVYKLAAIKKDKGWDFKVKLSEISIKVSNPGILSVKRFFKNNCPIGDMIVDATVASPTSELATFDNRQIDFTQHNSMDLLEPIFEKGQLVYELPDIKTIRNRTLRQLHLFNASTLKNYPVGLEQQLNDKKLALISRLKDK